MDFGLVAPNDLELHPVGNYLIANRLCNAFAAGEIGANDDFFLVGTPPFKGTDYPLLTGNILDSEGQLLFRLVQNEITQNLYGCTKTYGDECRYSIHDRHGVEILSVHTKSEFVAQANRDMFVTRLAGNFYNKSKQLVLSTQTQQGYITCRPGHKLAMGVKDGSVQFNQGMLDEDIEIFKWVVNSNGAIYEPLRGLIEDKEIVLDGKLLVNVQFSRCKLISNTGDFGAIGTPTADLETQWFMTGNTLRMISVYKQLGILSLNPNIGFSYHASDKTPIPLPATFPLDRSPIPDPPTN